MYKRKTLKLIDMKTTKLKFLIFISVVLVMGISGCTDKGGDIKKRFQAVEYIDTVYYDNRDKSTHYNFSIYLMKATGGDAFAEKVNSDIVEVIFGYENVSIEDAVEQFVNSSVTLFKEDITEIKEINRRENAGIPEFEYVYFLNSRVKDGGKGIVNYILDQYTYSGGAHGNTLVTCRNYSSYNGDLITLNDIFIPGYNEFLKPVLLEALKKKTQSANGDDLRSKGFLTMSGIYVPENYIIKSDTLKFIFNQYEIAPYSSGIIELLVPMSELSESWLKK